MATPVIFPGHAFEAALPSDETLYYLRRCGRSLLIEDGATITCTEPADRPVHDGRDVLVVLDVEED